MTRPFKLIHISDIHINDTPILEADPVATFEMCLANVVAHHTDADAIMITGDLTHHGTRDSYAKLREMLDDHLPDHVVRPHLMIGNHDDRATFREFFPEVACDDNGFIQSTVDVAAGRLVLMDTVEPGTHAGHYCVQRQAWLRQTLEVAEQDEKPVWLFMHHNPLPVQVANADLIGIVQEAALQEILRAYRNTIRHVFFGHCHYTLSGSVAGIPFSAPRSTNHPCWPDFSGDPNRMGFGGGAAPNYSVCFISDAGVVVHSIDFLSEPDAQWTNTDSDGWIAEE